MSHEPFSVEEVCDVRVQNSNVHCNSDSIERVTQQFDGKKEIERVSKSGRIDKTKSPRLHLYKKSCMCGTTPYMRVVLTQGRIISLYRASNWGGVQKLRRRLRTPNLLEACLEREVM